MCGATGVGPATGFLAAGAASTFTGFAATGAAFFAGVAGFELEVGASLDFVGGSALALADGFATLLALALTFKGMDLRTAVLAADLGLTGAFFF
jgi:hypothetical protein